MSPWWNISAIFASLTLTLCCAIIQGQRFPNYIVESDTPCTSEGNFRHPRNCSWFYRCESRAVEGYFYKYFFECAPGGTVFDNELDICVPRGVAKQPCGQNTYEPICVDYKNKGSAKYCFDICKGTLVQGRCFFNPVCQSQTFTTQYCKMSLPAEAGDNCEVTGRELCEKFNMFSITRASP